MISVLLLVSHRAALLLLPRCLHTIPFFFFFFFFTNNPFSVLGACTKSDHQALLQFQNSFTGYNLSKWTPWNASSSSDCCTWQGVTCDNSTVTALELPSLNISGTINALPSSLQTLNLSGNGFHGELPTNLIRSLPVLETLDLSNNILHGRLSDLLPFPPSLKSVNLSYNRFNGELPSNFSNSVQDLILAKNNLSGLVNPGLLCGSSDSLRVLDLSRNGFHGTLSYGFGFCASLQELDLGFNKFNGSIPDDIFSLAQLSSLSLDNNSFTGPISSNLSTSLTRLTFGNNFFTGPLPKTLPHLRNLVTLDLSNNNFNGSLSDIDFSNLTSLQVLNLYFNFFTGTIPVSLSNCTSLKVLDLALNFLTGYVPREFNALKKLTFVSISANKLSGSLQSFQDCDSLVSLYLSKNDFTEPLPTSVSFTKNLQVLALGFLNLKGSIPLWLKNGTKLQVLDLSWNSFEGQLPPWLGSFQHLIYLDLSNNTLTGSIPPQLFYLPSLVNIDTNFMGLQTVMDPVQVGHHSGLPDLTYFRALSLPPSIILSNNKLTGSIPSPNITIKVLAVLDLSHNDLTGSIPDSLSRIKNLERLDLSWNRLTGNIPSSLSKLTFLSTFNVSNNSLVGPIPMSNQFGTFSNTSYSGNPGLCGAPILPPCSTNSSQSWSSSFSQSFTKKRMIAILVICVVFGFAAISVTVVLVCMVSGRTAVHHGFGNSSEINYGRCQSEAQHATVQLLYNDKQLSVADIFHGTNNFNANNIVGCGGYGLVYRADLEDGSKLAIKKLTGDCGQMEREFKAEVEALSKARHNNLVPLKGFMQIGHSKLLIYAYMENGSLDYWLHERTDGASCLDWQTRLKIAHGAAAGLAYLHQICYPHIVHRDIKSSNILLNEMFEARLADFGLARLMMSTDTHVTTELVGTLGYIPPEYSEKSNATPRGDVYSFGVVLLELLTGRRPVDVCGSKESSDLISWVQQLRRTTNIDDVFDKSLRDKGFEEQMRKVLDIALMCINRDPQKRPSIKEVMFLLEEIRQAKLEEIRQNKLVTT